MLWKLLGIFYCKELIDRKVSTVDIFKKIILSISEEKS